MNLFGFTFNVSRISQTANQVSEAESYQTLLEEKERLRKEGYRFFWDVYKGEHWRAEELDTEEPTPVINKCFTYVNKSLAFLIGKPATVNYPIEQVESLLAPYVNLIIDNSGGMEKFTFEAAQMGSVTGDCFLKPVYDPRTHRVRIQVCDSEDVEVQYTFRTYQNNVPDKVVFRWKYLGDDSKIHTYEESWDDFTRIIKVDGTVDKDKSGTNILREVPLVHIRNIIVGKETYGMSDVHQIAPLNQLLNAAIRRFRDDVEYHGDPITLVYGARISQLEKGDGKLWGNLPSKSKVENLELQTDFPAQQKFIEYLEDALATVSGVPTLDNQHISNTSGVAMQMANLPIIELTDRKKLTYGSGFSAAVGMALRLLAMAEYRQQRIAELPPEIRVEIPDYDPFFVYSGILDVIPQIEKLYKESKDLGVRFKKWYDVEFQFSDYLPKDRLVELQCAAEELTMHVTTRKEVMKTLGKDNIETLLAEIDKEIKHLQALGVEQAPAKLPNKTQGMRDQTETVKGAAEGERKQIQ